MAAPQPVTTFSSCLPSNEPDPVAAPLALSTFQSCSPSNEPNPVADVDPDIVGALGDRGRAVLEFMHIEGVPTP